MKLQMTIIMIVFLTSCKLTDTDIVGNYKMKHFQKSTLNLKPDHTFEFIQNYRNPYLHPFEHPDENYFRTSGQWKLNKKILILNSIKDSLIYPLYNIITTDTSINKTTYLQTDPSYFLLTRKSNTTEFCNYVFYDIDKDTVPILFVKTPKGEMAIFHGSMKYFSWEKNNNDTLQFFFFGYRPLTIINSITGATNYIVNLQPEFKPNWFIYTQFKVTKNKIRHLKSGTKFER